jgi:hypothetical protein
VEVKLIPFSSSHKGVSKGPMDRFVEGFDSDPKEPLWLKDS